MAASPLTGGAQGKRVVSKFLRKLLDQYERQTINATVTPENPRECIMVATRALQKGVSNGLAWGMLRGGIVVGLWC